MTFPRRFSPRFRPSRAFSLLEILIAVSILVGAALALVVTLRGGGTTTEAFSAEHFTAMFLAQKVMEDINDRVAVNPHYFTTLVHAASGEALPVVDGKSPFFRLLENTENFGQLVAGEDDPIVKKSGQLYEQLKNFTCKVDSAFKADPLNPGQSYPNLLNITVTIGWKEKDGRQQTYRLSQLIHGMNDDSLKKLQTEVAQPFSEEISVKALFQFLDPTKKPQVFDMAAFTAFNQGGDPEVLRPLGAILAGLMMCESTHAEYDAVIGTAKKKLKALGPGAKASVVAKWREHLAHLREQKAATLFYVFARLADDIRKLAGIRPPVGEARLGKKLYAIRLKLVGVPVLLLNHLMKISLGFATAEATYREILIPPHPGVSPNRRISMTHHWMDLRKLGILMADAWKLDTTARLAEHQKLLQNLITAFEGRQPGFVEYLRYEKELARTLPNMKKELAGLADHIGRSLGVNDDLTKIQNKFY